jgi:tRNA pseudouridine55 synthase
MSSKFAISGILVLDKAVGLSSNHCLQKAKRLIGADKAGHTGTLDPLACGVLPLCFGEATKVAQFLLDTDKTYRTVIELGITTASGDKDGDIIARSQVPQFAEAELRQVVAGFVGTLIQQPSIYSALKQNGVPLYKLARAGLAIEPKFREIQIYALELLNWQHPYLELRVHCSKGTYVRTLAEDIGKALGVGAHLSYLQREQTGPFALADSISLEQLAERVATAPNAIAQLLVPMDSALQHLPRIELDELKTLRLRQGQVVLLEEEGAGETEVAETEVVRIYHQQAFIGMAERAGGRLSAKRLLSYLP